MNELIEFLTSKEIIVVYIVTALACLLGLTIYLIDKNYYKRKQRHNTKELNKLVEEVNEIIENEYEELPSNEVFTTPVLETIEPEPYSAKVNEQIEAVIVETPTVSEVKIEETKQEVVEEYIEQLEDEILEPIKVDEIKIESNEEQEVLEELTYTTTEPNKQEAQEELMRLTLELEKAEEEQKNIELTAYEEEQEENAIISLDELVAKSKEMYESNEYTQYQDEGNEPISLADLERRMNKVQEEVAAIENNTPETTSYDEPVITEIFDLNAVIPALEAMIEEPQQMVLDDFNTIKVEPLVEETKIEPTKPAYQATKKFERSPIISPIYGIERPETKDELELENTANYEKLDEEIKKTNEFLMTLRELQKNLD